MSYSNRHSSIKKKKIITVDYNYATSEQENV